jgi:hypothetical protein
MSSSVSEMPTIVRKKKEMPTMSTPLSIIVANLHQLLFGFSNPTV